MEINLPEMVEIEDKHQSKICCRETHRFQDEDDLDYLFCILSEMNLNDLKLGLSLKLLIHPTLISIRNPSTGRNGLCTVK